MTVVGHCTSKVLVHRGSSPHLVKLEVFVHTSEMGLN